MSESLMMRLAEHVGHEAAHEIIFQCAGKAAQDSLDLAEVVGADPRVLAHMSPEDIEEALDPVAYLGQSMSTVDAAIAQAVRIMESAKS